jgi:hypothetical protein
MSDTLESRVELAVEHSPPETITEGRNMPGSTEEVDGNRLILTINENIDSVIKAVANHSIENMNLKTYSLEELFLRFRAHWVGSSHFQEEGYPNLRFLWFDWFSFD